MTDNELDEILAEIEPAEEVPSEDVQRDLFHDGLVEAFRVLSWDYDFNDPTVALWLEEELEELLCDFRARRTVAAVEDNQWVTRALRH